MNNIIGILCAINLIIPTPNIKNDMVQKNDFSTEQNEIIFGIEAKEYAERLGIENYDNVEEVYISYNTEESSSNIMPCYFGDDYYIKEDTIVTTYEKGSLIRKSFYEGPSTAKMTISESISATFSFNFSIGIDELNAKLGYNKTSTFKVSDSYSIKIKDDSIYAIECYVNLEKKTFEIWEDDLFFDDYVGKYYSTRPVGCMFFKTRL